MKKYFGVLFAALLCSSAFILPVQAEDTDDVADSGNMSILSKTCQINFPESTTNADCLHNGGVKGQLKSGERLLAAIIDQAFYPGSTAQLKEKGVIHPASFSENLILDPDHPELPANIAFFEEEYFKKTTHGSGVAEAFHRMAPDAELLLIDRLGFGNNHFRDKNPDEILAWSIWQAINLGAKVINISSEIFDGPETVKVCKEAIRRDIPIFIAVGNDSSKKHPLTLDKKLSDDGRKIIRDAQKDLFDKVGGKGLYFVGAVKPKDGKEKLTCFTQHPTPETEGNFVVTLGSDLPILGKLNQDALPRGTSFASPVAAGGYLLALQHTLDSGFEGVTSQDIFELMRDTGRDVEYIDPQGNKKIYKSMDLLQVVMKIDEMAS